MSSGWAIPYRAFLGHLLHRSKDAGLGARVGRPWRAKQQPYKWLMATSQPLNQGEHLPGQLWIGWHYRRAGEEDATNRWHQYNVSHHVNYLPPSPYKHATPSFMAASKLPLSAALRATSVSDPSGFQARGGARVMGCIWERSKIPTILTACR